MSLLECEGNIYRNIEKMYACNCFTLAFTGGSEALILFALFRIQVIDYDIFLLLFTALLDEPEI
jgi:hypothetical protein